MNRSYQKKTYHIVFIAMMAAIVYVVTLLRFPLLGTKVHFANAMCLLAGLLLGPLSGGLAAGLGSAVYDATAGGYDLIQCLITFASKFAMAVLCAVLAGSGERRTGWRVTAACIAGALSYVVLYMLKTFVYQAFVYGFPMDAVWATMLSKLPGSLINAVAAAVAAPIFYGVLRPALEKAGIWEKFSD